MGSTMIIPTWNEYKRNFENILNVHPLVSGLQKEGGSVDNIITELNEKLTGKAF